MSTNKYVDVHIDTNTITFSVVDDRGDVLKLWCTHGNWDGLLNINKNTLTILRDSNGYLSEERRVMKVVENVKWEYRKDGKNL